MRLIVFLTLFSISLVSQARDGSSGCGPGWYVFQDNSLISSALRSTTNGFLFPTTTIGMTLGTSNCTQHKLVLHEKKALHFVTHNMYELKVEAAQGQGAYLQAMSEIIGCPQSHQKLLQKQLKANHNKVFEQENPEKILKHIFIEILSHAELTQACSLS
jgi:hypothetical protein